MSHEEVQKMIEDIIKEKSIQQMSQIGEVMGELKKRSNNRADMGFASKFVKEKFHNNHIVIFKSLPSCILLNAKPDSSIMNVLFIYVHPKFRTEVSSKLKERTRL